MDMTNGDQQGAVAESVQDEEQRACDRKKKRKDKERERVKRKKADQKEAGGHNKAAAAAAAVDGPDLAGVMAALDTKEFAASVGKGVAGIMNRDPTLTPQEAVAQFAASIARCVRRDTPILLRKAKKRRAGG